jgi:hypothetical protein
MFDNAGTLVVAMAFVMALVGSGVGVAFLVGRRGAGIGIKENAPHKDRLSEQFVRELERCVELGDYVTRDADALSAALAAKPPPSPREIASAVQQLIKTTKSLTGRLNRMASGADIERPEGDGAPATAAARQADATPTTPEPRPAEQIAVLAQEEVDKAPRADKDASRLPPSQFDDARRFPRSSFRGSAKATIYPRNPVPGREPIQCMVLTRDLSCGGIGIAHSEQLFPKQIVVIDAVGKLLVGEVRWCRRVDEHFYVAGCRLVKTNA